MLVTGPPATTASALAESGKRLEDTVHRMLEIGATVLEHGSNSATVESVSVEIDRLIETIGDVAAEQFPLTLQKHANEMETILGRHFDPGRVESVQQQLVKIMKSAAREQQRELAKSLVDDAGPFGILKADLGGKVATLIARQDALLVQLTGLQEKLAAVKAQSIERERGTAKGRDFETYVWTVVDDAYALYGDAVERVGTTLGAAGTKHGDVVSCINSDDVRGREAKIVIEAKCRKLSLVATLRELDDAMSNREADAGIVVFSSRELAPLNGASLRAYSGNRIIAAIEGEEGDRLSLEVACALARAFAVQAASNATTDLDVGRMEQHVARLVSLLDEARVISRGLNAARKGIDQVDTGYTHLRSGAASIIGEMEQDLRAATE